MYLFIGADKTICTKELIGVFDIDRTSISKNTRDFLRDAEKNGRIKYLSDDLPKSFVVCFDNDLNETVYITNVSSATIKKRMEKTY